MLIFRFYFDKNIKPYHHPATKFLVKHYVHGIVLSGFTLLLITSLILMVYIYLIHPGNSWAIYLNIGLIFMNLYFFIRSVQSLIALRGMIKHAFYLAGLRKQMHDDNLEMFNKIENELHEHVKKNINLRS